MANATKTAARNWKTSLSGLVGSAALFIATNPADFTELPHWLKVIAGFSAVGGFAALGLLGKDGDKTGVGAVKSVADVDKTDEGPAVSK